MEQKTVALPVTVVDAGARYGLHPTWQALQDSADFHLFEMDSEEADRLRVKYRLMPNIKVYSEALYSYDADVEFNFNEHKALSSLKRTNSLFLSKKSYMNAEFRERGKGTASARAIDSIFRDEVHFLKLDVEGSELDVLEGAISKLRSSVIGVRSEVMFAQIFSEAPLFGDIHNFLSTYGFELLNLDYTGSGNLNGKFTLQGRFGRLLSTDAVWTCSEDRIFTCDSSAASGNTLRLAYFLLRNGATDLCIDLLLRAKRREGLDFGFYCSTPLYIALRREILFLFKELLSLPQLDNFEIYTTFEEIFHEDFPRLNNFYESFL